LVHIPAGNCESKTQGPQYKKQHPFFGEFLSVLYPKNYQKQNERAAEEECEEITHIPKVEIIEIKPVINIFPEYEGKKIDGAQQNKNQKVKNTRQQIVRFFRNFFNYAGSHLNLFFLSPEI